MTARFGALPVPPLGRGGWGALLGGLGLLAALLALGFLLA